MDVTLQEKKEKQYSDVNFYNIIGFEHSNMDIVLHAILHILENRKQAYIYTIQIKKSQIKSYWDLLRFYIIFDNTINNQVSTT